MLVTSIGRKSIFIVGLAMFLILISSSESNWIKICQTDQNVLIVVPSQKFDQIEGSNDFFWISPRKIACRRFIESPELGKLLSGAIDFLAQKTLPFVFHFVSSKKVIIATHFHSSRLSSNLFLVKNASTKQSSELVDQAKIVPVMLSGETADVAAVDGKIVGKAVLAGWYRENEQSNIFWTGPSQKDIQMSCSINPKLKCRIDRSGSLDEFKKNWQMENSAEVERLCLQNENREVCSHYRAREFFKDCLNERNDSLTRVPSEILDAIRMVKSESWSKKDLELIRHCRFKEFTYLKAAIRHRLVMSQLPWE